MKADKVLYFSFALFLVLALSGSAGAQLEEPIIPDFVAEPISGPAPLSVNFTDATDYGIEFNNETMDVSFFWEFGDNQTEELTLDNVSHVYENPGFYTVTLTVTVTEAGEVLANESVTKIDYIEVFSEPVDEEYPVVDFMAEPLSGIAPLTVNFTDLSDFGPEFDPLVSNVTRFWEFGDGINFTSTEATGAYTYETPGIYDVTLTLFYTEGNETLNKSLTKEAYIEVLEGEPSPGDEYLKIDFIGEPRAGVAPLTVNFTPLPEFGPAFDPVNMTVEGLWEFGDGSNSTEMNATHVYETPGVYDVTATVNIIQDGITIATNSITKEQYIRVFDPETKGIILFPGWNFISVPYALENASLDYLFADVEYESVIYYDAASKIWVNVEGLEPLKGYGVFVLSSGVIPPEKLVLSEEVQLPGASLPIYEGWNAIGHTDSTGALSAEFTLKIIDDSYFEVIGPLDWANRTYSYIGRNGYEGDIESADDKYVGTDIFMMEPYKGYWLLATDNTTLYSVGW